MDKVQVRLYFDISKKGRSKRAQDLLQVLRDLAAASQNGYFWFNENAPIMQRIQFHTTPDPGIVTYDMGNYSEGKLPEPLSVLRPMRVTLTADGHFHFPAEGLYKEGAAEVSWTSENVAYGFENPPVMENRWKLSLTASTLTEAYDLYIRIRTGTAPMKHRWVDMLGHGAPKETGQDADQSVNEGAEAHV